MHRRVVCRLSELLRCSWKRLYTKAFDKRLLRNFMTTHRIHEGHAPVQRLLKGTARLIKL